MHPELTWAIAEQRMIELRREAEHRRRQRPVSRSSATARPPAVHGLAGLLTGRRIRARRLGTPGAA